MKKSFLIIAGCFISIVLFQAFTIMHEPPFKNLQILPKDISEHDLDSVMHHFSLSLGVRCNFCHVSSADFKKWDFANDDKPEKNIARKMMMMAIDINKNYFRGMEEMDHDMNMPRDSTMMKDSPMMKDAPMMKDSAMMKDHGMMMMTDTSRASASIKYMLRSVTCFTCHRGDPHPESKTPPPPPPKEGPPPPPKDADKK